MDGHSIEHSDSDSGESWTLLESNPTIADEAPEFADARIESPVPGINEKDEDTDGISIVTDSDLDSPLPQHINLETWITQEIRNEEPDVSQYVAVNASNLKETNESLRADDDFLADSVGKHKIYVHRRNKRLSTVLNIIVLGSVITAAGVALGHMWGAKNDCSIHTTPAVNKILSNLYKLQEENVFLRSKLKELSGIINTQQKLPFKQMKCKKVFEESLDSNSGRILTKCIDDKDSKIVRLESHLIEPLHEKEFVSDVNRLENIYQENKEWLDKEIAKRLKIEEEMWNNNVNKIVNDKKIEKYNKIDDKNNISGEQEITLNNISENRPIDKVSYADSLKSVKNTKKVYKREIDKAFYNDTNKNQNKRKFKADSNKQSELSPSDDEIKKDDRYIGQKNRQDKKKYNRQKGLKKQKRRNKYEQWEMKGGIIQEYDDISFSSHEVDQATRESDKFVLVNNEIPNIKNGISDKCTETENFINNKSQKNKKEKNEKKDAKKQAGWYENRVALRNEARKRLEQELFGDIAQNSARWYFKRMQKREQCRVKDNSTNRKTSKRNMNYKTKF